MKLIDLFKQQVVIKGSIGIPCQTTMLAGYKHKSKPIAQGKVLGDFYCSKTNITSLKQGPSWVGGNFSCHDTKITSLEGGPSYVGGNFSCYGTNITSLEQVPSWVGGHFNCVVTKITSLHNIHKQIKHIGGQLYLSNTVKSHILGVMFITGLDKIEIDKGNKIQKQVENIINKHLADDRNVHLVQEELLEAGLKEFAKL